MSSLSVQMMIDKNDDDDDDEDMAAKAYASIAAQLQQFTSPKLGTLSPDDYLMEEDYDNDHMDAVEWMKQDLQIQSPVAKTPRRTPLLERADTPVMSNSSSKREKGPERAMIPLQAFQAIPRPKVYSPRVAPAPVTKSSNPNQSPFVYRRYHDTLWNFLKAKRSLSHSLELEQKGQALEAMTLELTPPSSLASREERTEIDYLSQLQQLCWSNSSSETFLEGDFWLLLVTLRQLGLQALVWENDAISAASQANFLHQLACRIEETPAQLLQRLVSRQAPLVLQRRYSILQWIQACLDQVRLDPKKSFIHRKHNVSHPDDSEAPMLVSEETHQHMLQASLDFILAGRLEDAKALTRSNGQPWRAAVWSGGQPLGHVKEPNEQTKSMDVQPTGNPNRFLWKRQVWKNGRRLGATGNSIEAAISALLANDVQTCLANPHLRSWSQAMGAMFMGIWGRLEDEVLHMHNQQRRKQTTSLPYLGAQNLVQESEQLMATSHLAGMTEFQALQVLSSSPFAEIQGQGLYERAISAFCVGKAAISDYCHSEAQSFLMEEEDNDGKVAHLRFLTHLTLYLDSLHVSTTPIILNGITKQKNQILFQYVRYLESRPELWHLITLYVSLLPDEKLLQWYPAMLAKVLEDTERQAMLESMQALFPHLLLPVLKQTVRLCLNSHAAPDDIKCQSIRWLLYDENHTGEALVCSNILLRGFFLEEEDDKMDMATSLVEDYLPEDLLERADQTLPQETSSSSKKQHAKVANARTEHLAFLSYLDAYRTFNKWKDIMSETPTTIVDSFRLEIDMNNLNLTEQGIATQRIVRDWTRQKKKHCQILLEAAEQARSVLLRVLTHPGGWLALDDDDIEIAYDTEEQKRRKDMVDIQSRYLILAVNLYHQLCEETASWLSCSLDDVAHIMTREEALQSLQDKSYQPYLWHQYALDLAIVIADDRYGIHKALGPNALKDMLAKLAETAVAKLMSTSMHSH